MAFEGTPIDIPIKGIVRQGADSVAADGAMNEVIGLEYKDGSFVPYSPASLQASWSMDIVLIRVHVTDYGNKTIIVTSDNYLSELKYGQATHIKQYSSVPNIAFVGNMMCVCDNVSMDYYLMTEGGYVLRGEGDCDGTISVRVSRGLCMRSPNGGPYENYAGIRISKKLNAELDADLIDEKMMSANMMQAVGEIQSMGGLTGYSFAVVAYRMTNGDLVKASAPILLCPPNVKFGNRPSNDVTNVNADAVFHEVTFDWINEDDMVRVVTEQEKMYECLYNGSLMEYKAALPVLCSYTIKINERFKQETTARSNKLQYRVNKRELSNDISSVCIFLTKEILPYTFNQYGDFNMNVAELPGSQTMPYYTPILNNSENIIDKFNDLTAYYKVCEIPRRDIENAENGWIDVCLEGKLGDSLVVQEALSTTAIDRTSFFGGDLSVYNSRLHNYGYSIKRFDGYEPNMFAHTQAGEGQYECTGSISENVLVEYVFYVNDDGTERVFHTYKSRPLKYINPLISYPDPNAYKVQIRVKSLSDSLVQYYEGTFNLTRNDALGMAYVVLRMKINSTLTGNVEYLDIKPFDIHNIIDSYTQKEGAIPSFIPNEPIVRKNVMRVSDVNYPQRFDYINSYTIGNKSIIGVARLSLTLSNDKFGAFSFIVFCTDGIYAMEVDKSGSGVYTNITTFSNEICTNKNTICEIENAVVFASDKGLLAATSEGTQLYNPELNGAIRNAPRNDADYGKGLKLYSDAINNSNLVTLGYSISHYDFIDYARDPNTSIHYVSKKNKLLVCNDDYEYCYWIDIPTKMTTKLPIRISLCDMNYPDELFYAITDSVVVYKFNYRTMADTNVECMFATRPIKVIDTMKGTYRYIVRGKFSNGNADKWAALILLGSLDNERWQVIGLKEKQLTSEGFMHLGTVSERVGIKYLMAVLVCELDEESHIDGMELTVEERYNNKLK